jgi:hypothetical protein
VTLPDWDCRDQRKRNLLEAFVNGKLGPPQEKLDAVPVQYGPVFLQEQSRIMRDLLMSVFDLGRPQGRPPLPLKVVLTFNCVAQDEINIRHLFFKVYWYKNRTKEPTSRAIAMRRWKLTEAQKEQYQTWCKNGRGRLSERKAELDWTSTQRKKRLRR